MNELSNEQQAMSQLYSVLCAVVGSDRTPKHTAGAIIDTLVKLFEDENGPFQADEHMQGMTMAMAEAMNEIVNKRNEQLKRVAEGNSILSQYNLN
jgi:hypothetical protein